MQHSQSSHALKHYDENVEINVKQWISWKHELHAHVNTKFSRISKSGQIEKGSKLGKRTTRTKKKCHIKYTLTCEQCVTINVLSPIQY